MIFYVFLSEVFIIIKIFKHYIVAKVLKFTKFLSYKDKVNFDDIYDAFE